MDDRRDGLVRGIAAVFDGICCGGRASEIYESREESVYGSWPIVLLLLNEDERGKESCGGDVRPVSRPTKAIG